MLSSISQVHFESYVLIHVVKSICSKKIFPWLTNVDKSYQTPITCTWPPRIPLVINWNVISQWFSCNTESYVQSNLGEDCTRVNFMDIMNYLICVCCLHSSEESECCRTMFAVFREEYFEGWIVICYYWMQAHFRFQIEEKLWIFNFLKEMFALYILAI